MPKQFTEINVDARGQFPRINADRADLVYDPPQWMNQGLTQTASGYGARLNSGYKIHYCGRVYRIYVTCYSNSGTSWFVARGRRIIVS
jgi:hypothetical protein